MGKRVWSDETREQVSRLFAIEGFSYGQISQRLGMTRDVVAGLVNRLKLTGKGRNAAHGGHRKRQQKVEDRPLKAAASSLIDLGRACCAWPIGDPRDPEFRFCGTPIDGKSPYCLAHRQKAYAVSQPREKREKTHEERRDRRALWG